MSGKGVNAPSPTASWHIQECTYLRPQKFLGLCPARTLCTVCKGSAFQLPLAVSNRFEYGGSMPGTAFRSETENQIHQSQNHSFIRHKRMVINQLIQIYVTCHCAPNPVSKKLKRASEEYINSLSLCCGDVMLSVFCVVTSSSPSEKKDFYQF